MLLSVPLTMTAKIAMENFDETRWIAALLSGGATENHGGPGVTEHVDSEVASAENAPPR